MKKVLVAGASGGLGKQALKACKERGHFVRALVTNQESADKVKDKADEVVIGDALKVESLDNICDQIDIVFSAIGKNVSLFSQDDKSFFEVDYTGNKNLIDKAKASKVKRFVYVSIYGSDVYGNFELARVHRRVEKKLSDSEISYTVIRPVALFVGLLDLLRMAKNGLVITPGNGQNRTNPIHEEDLASVCIDHLENGPETLEVGGPVIYTRNQIAELAIQAAGGSAQHLHLNEPFSQGGLLLANLYDQSFFDKLAFFNHVLTHDVIAPQYGSKNLDGYFHAMAAIL